MTEPNARLVPSLLAVVHAVVLAASLAAQRPDRAPTFTLAPGEHHLRELVDLCALVEKTTVRCDEATAAILDGGRLHVQRELRLPGDAFVDVASNLLFEAGVVLASEPGEEARRVVAIDDAQALLEVARDATVDELLARPLRVDYVRAALPFGDVARANMLRPFLGFGGGPWFARLRVDAAAEQLTLIGTTPQVAAGLRMLQAFDGAAITQPARTRWAAAPRPWPGGDMLLAEFVATFCEATDANVLGELPNATLALGAAAELPPEAWYEAATRALLAAGQVLVPLCAEHRVFALRSLAHRPAELSWRARHETVAELGASGAVEPVMVVFELQSMDATAAVNLLRPKLAGLKVSLGSVMSRPNDVVLNGLRPDVQQVVELLLKADSR